MADSRVAVLKTSPENVIEDYARLMRLVSYRDVLCSETETVLSIDLSWHHFFPACSTTPWQLDGVISKLLDDGYSREKIYACFNKTAAVSVEKGEILNRQRTIVEKHSIRNVHLKEEEKWSRYEPTASMSVLGKIFPDGIRIPDCFFGSNVILLPTMKTHIYVTLAGALYTAFGGLLEVERYRAHSVFHEALVDTLTIMKELNPGMLAVMDGTYAGEGPGPRRLVPHAKNYIAASSDLVALDTVIAHMMGFDPLSIPFIRQAHEAGLGTGDIHEVEILGDDVKEVNFHFQVNPGMLDSAMWKLETALPGTILAPLACRGSMMYHDWYWYISVGEKRIKEAMKSGWEKLFESYRK